jgi:hypothetical protein
MIDNYVRIFKEQPKFVTSPLAPGDHPELDDSPLLDQDGVTQYLSLIGQLQWLISMGRFDIMQAVVALSTFRAQPRIGHLERSK